MFNHWFPALHPSTMGSQLFNHQFLAPNVFNHSFNHWFLAPHEFNHCILIGPDTLHNPTCNMKSRIFFHQIH